MVTEADVAVVAVDMEMYGQVVLKQVFVKSPRLCHQQGLGH
jgi:hypothetical protein